jgi:hypothetical protein
MTDRHRVQLCRRGIGAREARVTLGDGTKQLLGSMAYPSGICTQASEWSEVEGAGKEPADTVREEAQIARWGHFLGIGPAAACYEMISDRCIGPAARWWHAVQERATAATFGGALTVGGGKVRGIE